MGRMNVTITKSSKDDKLGLTLQSEGKERPVVSDLLGGLATGVLVPGDVIISVNGRSATGHEDTNAIIQGSTGKIEFVICRDVMDEALANPEAVAHMLAYFKKHFNAENLLFMTAVKKFKADWESQEQAGRQAAADALKREYILPDAPTQVNASLTEKYQADLDNLSRSMFDKPQQGAEKAMREELWFRFSDSPESAPVRELLFK